MKVREIMSTDLTSGTPDMNICDAASLMKKNNVGWLPILQGNKIVGILTDRDITCRCTAEECDPLETTCDEIMTRNCFFCHADDSIQSCVDLMSQKKVRRLAVLDDENKLSGVISMSDLVTRVHDRQMVGELLEQVCLAPANA